MRLRDLTGQRFGRLIATDHTRIIVNGRQRVMWVCLCDCGVVKDIDPTSLVVGNTTSCGCFRAEFRRAKAIKHGEAYSKEHAHWRDAKARCYNPRTHNYHRYGGRGVTMCSRWREDFSAFLNDMGRCPAGYSLDRINNEGHYTPTNCRWADYLTQCNNRDSRLGVPKGTRLPIKIVAPLVE